MRTVKREKLHRCRPPMIWWNRLDAGTLWECDCGVRWVIIDYDGRCWSSWPSDVVKAENSDA